MDLIRALADGQMPEFGHPDRVLETAISHLFFFNDRVVKVYKHEPYFFADLREITSRRKFFQDDFFWNNLVAPEIYQELVGVRGANLARADVAIADDFFILMKKIDTSATLTRMLHNKTLAFTDLEHLTARLVELFRSLSEKKMGDYKHLTDKGRRQSWQENAMDSLRPWLELSGGRITSEENKRVVDFLQVASDREAYFSDYDPHLFSVVIDNNCDNIIFSAGVPSFIDIMPPKEEWRVADEYEVIARTAVDALVLGGPEYARAVYDTYRRYRADAPESVKNLYELRAALIQWPYRHALGQHDLADKYRRFVVGKMEEMEI